MRLTQHKLTRDIRALAAEAGARVEFVPSNGHSRVISREATARSSSLSAASRKIPTAIASGCSPTRRTLKELAR
jgi:hypothetical protein